MIINKEEIEKAALEYAKGESYDGKFDPGSRMGFEVGVEFSEEYVQQYVQDIITENQGLKLYKDNEAKRFKELAVEFAEWLEDMSGSFQLYNVEDESATLYSNDELFEIFKSEKDDTTR
jgi:hypothetical protein